MKPKLIRILTTKTVVPPIRCITNLKLTRLVTTKTVAPLIRGVINPKLTRIVTTRTVFPLSGKAFVELRSFLGEGVGKERRGEGNELDTHSPICE